MFWIKRNWENRIKSSLIHSVMCWAPCVFKWSGMNHHPSKVCMIKPFLNLNWIHAHQRPHPISFISTGVASHLKVTSEFVELDDLENSTLQCSMISADILIAEVLTGLQIFAVDFYPEGVGIFAGTRPLLLRVHHFWVHLCTCAFLGWWEWGRAWVFWSSYLQIWPLFSLASLSPFFPFLPGPQEA